VLDVLFNKIGVLGLHMPATSIAPQKAVTICPFSNVASTIKLLQTLTTLAGRSL
jgi:hypothetical protein